MRGGPDDIARHPWFAVVDWVAISQRRRPGPLTPILGAVSSQLSENSALFSLDCLVIVAHQISETGRARQG